MEGPNKEFADPEQVELINSFPKHSYFKCCGTKEVPQAIYALLWLSDIEKLRELIYRSPLHINFELCGLGIKQWLQKKGGSASKQSRASSVISSPATVVEGMHPPSTPQVKRKLNSTSHVSSAEAPHGKRARIEDADAKDRLRSASQQTKERDGGCIIQRVPCVDVVHIFPSSLRNFELSRLFILILRMFWNKERVDAWVSAAYDMGSSVDMPHNLISLSPTAHKLHDEAFFAFNSKYYHEDKWKKSIGLKFHWLKRAEPRARVPLTEIPSLDLEMPSDFGLFIYEKGPGQGHNIKSGEIVRVETDRHDSEQKPLPSKALIEMQWILNRVAALSTGLDEPEEEPEEDDSDEDDFHLS